MAEPTRLTVTPGAYTQDPPADVPLTIGGANEAKGSIFIEIGGQRYKDFVQFVLRRNTEEIAGAGVIVMSWPGAENFNASGASSNMFEACAKGHIYLDGQLACTFRVWERESHGTPNTFTLAIKFRGIQADAVDSHVLDHPSGEENNKTPKQIVERVLQGLDIPVRDISSFQRKIKKFVFGGEPIDRLIRRATRDYGLHVVEEPTGGVVIQPTKYSKGNGQPLVLGRNFTEWQVHQNIVVQGQTVWNEGAAIPDDNRYGKQAEEMAAKATNSQITCARRINVKHDGDHDPDSLKQTGEANAIRRSAQGTTVTLTLSTWSDDSGQLWEPLKTHHVTIPVDQIDEDLRVKSVEYFLSKNARTTKMTLTNDGMAPGGAPETMWNPKIESQSVTGGSMAPEDI